MSEETTAVMDQVPPEAADQVDAAATPDETKAPVDETNPPSDETKPAAGGTDSVPMEIVQAERDCEEKEAILKDAKQEMKAAKLAFDSAVDKLRRLIREFNQPTLFNQNQSDVATASSTPEADDALEDWRLDLINNVLDLSESILKKLNDAGIQTMGELVDYTDSSKNNGYQRLLTEIDGIGGVANEKISKATEAYWEKRAKDKREREEQEKLAKAEGDKTSGLHLHDGDDEEDEDEE